MRTEEGNQLRHTLRERMLLLFSREPDTSDYEAGRDKWTPENSLSQLCRFFPGFLARIAGKEILDLGCGTGYQSVALAQVGAKHVVGLDMNTKYLEEACELARQFRLTQQVEFIDHLGKEFEHRFDVVISHNSMEHFSDPLGVLNQMKVALNDSGTIFITFGCPWFSPYGSHMHFFVRVPWVNILFDEKTVMKVRNHFRKDGATKYEQVEGGLNKMSVAKFEKLIWQCGLKVTYKQYEGVKGINFLTVLPVLRELFINNISCILQRDS